MRCGRPVRVRDAQGLTPAANRQSAGADSHNLRLRLPNHFPPPASREIARTATALVKANFLAGVSDCGPGRLPAPLARPLAPHARLSIALFRSPNSGTSATERDLR